MLDALGGTVRPPQFHTVSDLARRAQLDRHDLQVLAAAYALSSLAGNRREALWQSVAAVPDKDMLSAARAEDETPELVRPPKRRILLVTIRLMSVSSAGSPFHSKLLPKLLSITVARRFSFPALRTVTR